MTLTPVTVTASEVIANGVPATGTVEFTPTSPFRNGTVEVAQVPVVMQLVAGSLSGPLYPNDDPATVPAGTGYHVLIKIQDAPDQLRTVIISHTTATVDLTQLADASTGTPLFAYLLSSTVGQPNGVASLDSTGLVPTTQIPPIGALGGVTPAALTAEATTRAAADSTLTTNLASEVTNRATAVSGEATARTAADLLQIPLTQKGAANGVASLDATTKIPVAQIPSLSGTYALAAEPIGAAAVPKDAQQYSVKDHGAVGNGTTDDLAAIQALMTAVSAAGGGTVYFPPSRYLLSAALAPVSNVVLLGCGRASVLFRTTSGKIINATTIAFSDFTVDNLTFEGTVNQTVTVPTRARTTSGAGATTAIYIDGSLDPTATGAGVISNVTIRDCHVRNCSSLPILIGGVGGVVRVVNNSFYNNQDVGFIYNAEVICANNHILMSADNGISISRGNNKVTCVGNTIENCAYDGIWLTGFDDGSHNLNRVGPTHFSCTGNTIINVGYNGIQCDQAPQIGAVTGNVVNQGYNRGPSDQPSDTLGGCGILIGGYPSTARTAPTAFALGINVVGNTLYQCARVGIYVSGGVAITIDANLILNTGTQYLADGSTVIASSDGTQNLGIQLDNSTTNTDITVRNNTILDERATPYCNFAIAPQSPTNTTYMYYANQMAGCRNAYNLIDTQLATREIANQTRFDAITRHTLGASAGSNAGSGTIVGFDINGAAGSSRRHRIQTASGTRWAYGGSGTAEAGSNAGTDFTVQAYDDSGTLLSTPLTITRSTGAVALPGGLLPVHSGFSVFGTGGVVNLLNVTSGASVVMVAGTRYWAALLVPFNCTLTGVMLSAGTTGGTDSWIGSLYDSSGTLLANSALAGTAAPSANQKIKLPFTAPVVVPGPAVYYLALQSNGTTAKFLAFSNALEGFVTGSATGTFGTLPALTPGSSYIASVGPYANTY